jgi:hypothetical protein
MVNRSYYGPEHTIGLHITVEYATAQKYDKILAQQGKTRSQDIREYMTRVVEQYEWELECGQPTGDTLQ